MNYTHIGSCVLLMGVGFAMPVFASSNGLPYSGGR